jgi:hypothetical protein
VAAAAWRRQRDGGSVAAAAASNVFINKTKNVSDGNVGMRAGQS